MALIRDLLLQVQNDWHGRRGSGVFRVENGNAGYVRNWGLSVGERVLFYTRLETLYVYSWVWIRMAEPS